MLCARCLRSSSRPPLSLLTSRTFVSTPSLHAGTPPTDAPLPATSTEAAQPYLEPGPARPAGAGGKPRVKSGTPAGTILKHINFLKNKQDPIALEDSEYPDWLWTLLDKRAVASGDSGAAGDAYSKSKKERALAKKRSERIARIEAKTEIRIPPHEQTVDLPFATVPDPTAPNSIAVPDEAPFTRVVSAVGGVGQNIPAQLPSEAKPGSKGARGAKPSTVEIGKDLHVTPLEAQNARLAIRRGLRTKQRKAILEKNFLSTLKG